MTLKSVPGDTLPHSGQMTITPEKAAQILAEHNTHNRKASQTVVSRYARDMKAGKWLLNGDAIRFAVDGTLLDGQHRLMAVVKSGATIRTFVVWNLPLDVQPTMDDGRKRTMANVLQLDGKPEHAKTVASIARRLILAERGYFTGAGDANPTKAEMQEFVAEHPSIYASAEVADHIRGSRGVRCAASTLGVAHFMFSEKSPQMAAEFFELLRTGVGLTEGHPVLVLRDRLAVDGSTRVRTESPEVLAWFIRAWNAYRQGRSIKILRHKANDKFPVAI